MPFARVGMEYDRTPSEADERLVWAVAPPSEKLSWLKLVWEPGDAWQPIHRWIIWQMRPVGKHPRMLHDVLHGPHPRSSGHYCAVGWCGCTMKANHWVGGPASGLVDRMTYELFQRTGCYGQRWWVVQGTNGGHRFQLDRVEAKLWKLHTGASDTPKAGDLPYAPIDRRVLRHLLDYDRLPLWKQAIAFGERNAGHLSAECQAEVEKARLALVQHMDNQADLFLDTYGSRFRRLLQDVPTVHGQRETDHEATIADYVTAPDESNIFAE